MAAADAGESLAAAPARSDRQSGRRDPQMPEVLRAVG